MKALEILMRLREPSTWAGISILLTLFGVPPGVPDALGSILAGIGAVAAVVLKEKGAAPAAAPVVQTYGARSD